jgi:regulator of ribonuclease activity A
MTTATADLYDEHGDDLQSVPLQFQDVGGVRAFSGPVRTVKCHEDNALLKSVLSTPGAGAVLVVDGGGSLERALMGDMIATIAIENGWSGVIINGAIRDRAVLADLQLGIKALGSNPRKSTKNGSGEVDVPVTIGGVVFQPGARVHADPDGILVEKPGP